MTATIYRLRPESPSERFQRELLTQLAEQPTALWFWEMQGCEFKSDDRAMTMKPTAYEQGFDAYHDGLKRIHNPYIHNATKQKEWYSGYDEAKKQNNAPRNIDK